MQVRKASHFTLRSFISFVYRRIEKESAKQINPAASAMTPGNPRNIKIKIPQTIIETEKMAENTVAAIDFFSYNFTFL